MALLRDDIQSFSQARASGAKGAFISPPDMATFSRCFGFTDIRLVASAVLHTACYFDFATRGRRPNTYLHAAQ